MEANISEKADESTLKPVLIYDGNCGFCYYWVRYWQQLTGSRVDYQPFQSVMDDYPDIPVEDFQRAVQYISPEGQRSSGAEASFLTLSHAPGKAFWLILYRKIFGFAAISEAGYTFISQRRSFFHFLSKFLWGKNPEPPKHHLVSWLLMRSLGIIFLIAFFSFTTQSLGLIGSQGILPLNELKEMASSQLGLQKFWQMPMLFWLNSSDTVIQIVGWVGMLASLGLTLNFLPRTCLLLIYILYLSYIHAGQAFMAFQWDSLLVESAILSIFLLSFPILGVWLLRWLLFRFVFAAGMVKILSGDPSWFNLTALHYHFFTQPLPTPLAWYADLMPAILLKFATLSTLVIELLIPFLIFTPRRLRFFAGYSFLILQIGILLTGNYNFFNITTIALCLVLFDDAAIRVLLPNKLSRFIAQKPKKIHPGKPIKIIAISFAIITILASIAQFNIRFGITAPRLVWLNNIVTPLRVVNTYGPFAVMTKARYEIIIEGSNDGETWREYAFKYKPGDIYRRPLWNIPFQPRLDWQMWFAALTNPMQNSWYIRFIHRLLENSPEVIALLETNPYPGKPPRYVRSQFYIYYFTNSREKAKTGAWWKRRLIGSYLPSASLT